jgi:hypothetical protein
MGSYDEIRCGEIFVVLSEAKDLAVVRQKIGGAVDHQRLCSLASTPHDPSLRSG